MLNRSISIFMNCSGSVAAYSALNSSALSAQPMPPSAAMRSDCVIRSGGCLPKSAIGCEVKVYIIGSMSSFAALSIAAFIIAR